MGVSRFALAASALVGAGCASSPPPPVVVDAGAPTSSARSAPAPSRKKGEADAARVEADVRALAIERSPGSAGWFAARERCATRLASLGFEPRISRFMFPGVPSYPYTYENVVGVKRGTSRPDEEVIVSAHYDHVSGCPGADDDASGVAATLEIARLLAPERHERTLVVACWDLEEDGLVGSTYYANHAKDAGANIKLAVALDAVGYTNRKPNAQELPPGLQTLAPRLAKKVEDGEFRGDFIALVHDPDSADLVAPFETEAEAIGLRTGILEVSSLERLIMNDVLRADHASFWLAGYPAMLISDSGEFRNPGYHCWEAIDGADTLDYPFLTQVTSATTAMVRSALDAH
ncbi:MAG: M28 family peptidase [Polyangiaceae bacterium]